MWDVDSAKRQYIRDKDIYAYTGRLLQIWSDKGCPANFQAHYLSDLPEGFDVGNVPRYGSPIGLFFYWGDYFALMMPTL